MRRSLAVLLVATSLVALPTGATAVPTERAAGTDRVLTAVALSQEAFGAADAAVVASSATFADALGAAPLAATLGGPLLLTPPDALRDEVGAELDRLGVETVHLMGGTGAVAGAVEDALVDDGHEVVRHAGTNRFDTAALAAAAQAAANGDAPVERVYVALGSHPDDDSRAWPDALAAGVLAGVQDQPILLVTPSAVPAATQQAITDLDPDEVVVIGGTGAIPDAVMDDLGPDGTTRRRIGGASRYDTAGLLADAAVAAGADGSRVTIATGRAFPDALAAGAATVALGGVLVLVDGRDLDHSRDAEAWLARQRPGSVLVAGGEAAVDTGTVGQVERAIDGFAAPALRLEPVALGLPTLASRPGFDPVMGVTTPGGDTRLHLWTRSGGVYARDAGGWSMVLDISRSVDTTGEGGLLGVAFPANHATSARFFVHYTARDATGNFETRISEFTRTASVGTTGATERILFTLDQPATNHNGGTITFAPDGSLLVFLGDGGGGNDQYGHGQRADTPFAAALRFDVSERGLAFPAGAGIGHSAVWMFGLRNPFRADIDPVTGLLHIGDVGQGQWEEVDVVPWAAGGTNFGWSEMEGNHCVDGPCDPSRYTAPVAEYGHGSDGGCSITGGVAYRGDIGMLRGHFFYGDYCTGLLRSLRVVDGVVVETADFTASLGGGQIWSFGRDGDGEVYVSKGDQLYRIVPA